MHRPRKPWLIAAAIYVLSKMADGIWGDFGTNILNWARTFIPADAVDQLGALGFWYGAGLVLICWGIVEIFFSPAAGEKKKEHWITVYNKRGVITGDAPVVEVATYIYERTGWGGGTDNVIDQLGREIADQLAARRLSGWVRQTNDRPLNKAGAQFWDNVTIDVLGAIVVKPFMHGGHGTYYDLRLSWAEVRKVWPSRYPALLLPLLQLIRVARKM